MRHLQHHNHPSFPRAFRNNNNKEVEGVLLQREDTNQFYFQSNEGQIYLLRRNLISISQPTETGVYPPDPDFPEKLQSLLNKQSTAKIVQYKGVDQVVKIEYIGRTGAGEIKGITLDISGRHDFWRSSEKNDTSCAR